MVSAQLSLCGQLSTMGVASLGCCTALRYRYFSSSGRIRACARIVLFAVR